jgi:glycosyltransferase involved in cell wall biosynthesis
VNEKRQVTFVELPSVRTAVTGRFRFGVHNDGDIRIVRLPPLPRLVRRKLTALEPCWLSHAAAWLKDWIPGLDRAILLASTPWWANLVERLPRALCCYDYIDHVSVHAFGWDQQQFAEWDERLLRASDLILTVSQPLATHLAERFPSDRIHLVPNGVRGEWVDSAAEPWDRARLTSRPDRLLVGFVGSLFEWIDFDLIVEVARRLPDVEFVFVGPTRRQVPLDPILGLPNVRYLPPAPFDQVPALIKAFDVCTIPFKRDIVSLYADPLKIYEYCALGKPVVSTVAFLAAESAPVNVAETPEAFAAALVAARDQDSPARRKTRTDYARRHTWEARAQAMLKAFEHGSARNVSQG